MADGSPSAPPTISNQTQPASVDRDLASLRSVLSRAVEFGVLREHPLSKLKASRVDERGVVRYLTPDEEKQLRTALAARAVTIHDRLERDKTLVGEVAPDGRAGIAGGNVFGRHDSERGDGRQRSDV